MDPFSIFFMKMFIATFIKNTDFFFNHLILKVAVEMKMLVKIPLNADADTYSERRWP